MVAGRLYQKEDGYPLMRLCINKEAAAPYLEHAHVAIGNMDLSPKQTLNRIRHMGFYWPTMYKDMRKHIKKCTCQGDKSQAMLNAITLYKMSLVAPKWVEALVEYKTTNVMPKKMSKVRQRYLQKHS